MVVVHKAHMLENTSCLVRLLSHFVTRILFFAVNNVVSYFLLILVVHHVINLSLSLSRLQLRNAIPLN